MDPDIFQNFDFLTKIKKWAPRIGLENPNPRGNSFLISLSTLNFFLGHPPIATPTLESDPLHWAIKKKKWETRGEKKVVGN